MQRIGNASKFTFIFINKHLLFFLTQYFDDPQAKNEEAKLMRTLQTSVFVCAIVLSACGQSTDSEPPSPVRPTKLIEIAQAQTLERVRLPAIIEAADQSTLTFQVPGLLNDLPLLEGADVKKGAVLAILDQREFRNTLAAAEADFKQAKTEYDRAERLFSQNAIAETVVRQRQTDRDRTRAALDSASKQLADAKLVAPFDGIVADIHAEQFETVGAQQAIVTVQSTGRVDAVIQVPATLLINAETYEPQNVQLELDAAPGVLISAALKEHVAKADPATQTFEVRYTITPPEDLLVLPGMTGILTGEIPASDKSENPKAELPISAVLSDAGQTFVWIVDTEKMSVQRRDIEIQSGEGVDMIVNSGLVPGDIIVAAGGHYLFEGAKISAFEP